MKLSTNFFLRNAYKKLDILRVCLLYVQKVMRLHQYSSKTRSRSSDNTIEIIPHEGLGDLIALIPAFKSLCDTYEKVWVQIERQKFEILSDTFKLPGNLYCVHKSHTKSYKLERADRVPKVAKKLIALGNYASAPIYKYPLSFYDQLAVSRHKARDEIELNKSNILKINLGPNYVYVNLSTSKGENKEENIRPKLASLLDVKANKIVEYIDNETLLLSSETAVEKIKVSGNTFEINLALATEASACLISDAAIYNALIRLRSHPLIYVRTRNPLHTHCVDLYKHKFDGDIHIVEAKTP